MLGLQLNLPSFLEERKNNGVQYSLDDVLNIYRKELKNISLNLKEHNGGYDFYRNTLFIWLEISNARLEKKVLNLQTKINKRIKSSEIKIHTTVMSDWSDLPLPDGYSSLIES